VAEGFRVARSLTARSATATSARATLTTSAPSIVTLAGRASVSTSARGALARSRPLSARADVATSGRGVFVRTRGLTARAPVATFGVGDLTVFSAKPPPGVFAMFRELVAQVLRSLDVGAEVHPLPVDALSPPAFFLKWADPWTEPATHCLDLAHLQVVCVAARVDVEPGIETLELMVEGALAAFNRAGIPHGITSGPRPLDVGGVAYLAAEISVSNTVNVGS
jgi:hypothetical protein